MIALDILLDTLPPWTLVGGKGGVGKTTCAAALAARSAERGARTLLLSTDPAETLGDAIGVRLGAEPQAVPDRASLSAMQLDATAARNAFLGRWRGVLVRILDRGTYLDDEDITGLIDAALPGADEAMAMLTLAELADSGNWDRVVIDTAPTGHTLRLLGLPRTFAALVELLDTMQAKHRLMVSALTHRYRADEADAFIEEMRAQIGRLRALLTERARCAMVLITRPEDVVTAETLRYAASLGELGIGVGALVVNAMPIESGPEAIRPEALRAIALLDDLDSVPRFEVDRLDDAPMGLAQIVAWGRAMRESAPDRTSESAARIESFRDGGRRGVEGSGRPGVEASARRDMEAQPGAAKTERPRFPIRRLTIVGGKGGVGKTSAACALAIEAAPSARVLLVSTDPAPSIADALAQPIGDLEAPVDGAPGLIARQMDAEAAFERLRTDYRDRVDALFDGLIGRGFDAAHDRAIVRDLMTLAPPGIDELYALASLGQTLADARFDFVIVDPAPTGHLLRLLEMPALALEWSHRLLRLMLKYREVVGLGETAEELLAFAKRTRSIRELLADHERAGLFVVALDEPLVRGETNRLLSAVAARGVGIIGLLWNRAGASPAPLSLPGNGAQFVSAEMVPPPVGVAALRRWRDDWIPLAPTHG